jgi:hypothetical protein
MRESQAEKYWITGLQIGTPQIGNKGLEDQSPPD